MLFRPARVIRVTTEQELDSALATADQVIVEGDDRLLSYAATRASGDPKNSVAVEVGGRSISVGADFPGTTWMEHGSEDSAALPGPAEVGATSARLAGRRGPVWKIALYVVLPCLLLGVLGGSFVLQTRLPSPLPAAPVVTPPPTTQPERPNAAPLRAPPGAAGPTRGIHVSPGPPPAAASPDVAAVLQTLAWPAVSIVAIVALFFIARQAIAGGRNVEVSWKVTEKIAGRVVITKVRTPVRRERSAA